MLVDNAEPSLVNIHFLPLAAKALKDIITLIDLGVTITPDMISGEELRDLKLALQQTKGHIEYLNEKSYRAFSPDLHRFLAYLKAKSE